MVRADQRERGVRDPQGGVEGGADPGRAVRREPLVNPQVLHREGAGELEANGKSERYNTVGVVVFLCHFLSLSLSPLHTFLTGRFVSFLVNYCNSMLFSGAIDGRWDFFSCGKKRA